MEQRDFMTLVLPNIVRQLRASMSTLHLAASSLVTQKQREEDPVLDRKVACLDQSYYQMLRQVNELTQAMYLTEETMNLPLEDGDIVSTVGEICTRVETLAQMKGLTLKFRCRAERHVCAFAPDALEQLLMNLLSNAMKFTPAGGTITVELRMEGKQVLLSVADTGCGIPEERMDSLFERYLHPELLDAAPYGLGLGLALSRRIAECHGGTLLAQSTVGEGSRFTFAMPDRYCRKPSMQAGGFDYAGGFNRTLLSLADALPVEAFRVRNE